MSKQYIEKKKKYFIHVYVRKPKAENTVFVTACCNHFGKRRQNVGKLSNYEAIYSAQGELLSNILFAFISCSYLTSVMRHISS